MDAVMDKFMGQQVVKDMSDAAGFILERSKFVSTVLSAKLDEVNVEKEVLNHITLFRSGGTVGISKIGDSERYLDYLLVDRMIKEVSPIFEAFGLGGSSNVFSWASIMEEVKAQLIGVSGLAQHDQDDLLRSEAFGLQSYVCKALKAANETTIEVFGEKDPLALVERGRLLPEGDCQYNLDLTESRKDIEARRSEQRKFPKAYTAGTSAALGQTNSIEVAKQQRQMEKLKGSLVSYHGSAAEEGVAEELSSLKAQQKVLSRRVDNSRGVAPFSSILFQRELAMP